jgi:DNA-binding CsgD family transcriptional regulator
MRTLLHHTLSPLTRREYQLADCIMRGQRRSEIAEEMGVKPETVTKYTNQLYNKFGIHRRQDLFRLAEQLDREWLDKD